MKFETALVTGANSGLGFEAAAQLAEQGTQRVIIACRNPQKAATAVTELEARTGKKVFEFEQVDLADTKSAAALARRLVSSSMHIDLLLLNASNDSLERVQTDEGFELTLATNVVGHHVLTVGLIEGGALSENARIVASTSEIVRSLGNDRLYNYDQFVQNANSVGDAALAVLRGQQPAQHKTMSAYANAKLWTVWWVRELADRLPPGMAAFAVSPGATPSTRSPASLPWPLRIFFLIYRLVAEKVGVAWSVSEGARQYLVGAAADVDESGEFLGAPQGKPIGPLERQVESHYTLPGWGSAVWSALVQETGWTLERTSEQEVITLKVAG